jgi:hypothetical protein
MSALTHSLVGYDRATQRVADEYEVPDRVLARAKQLARVPAGDPDVMMCYPLGASEARDLADVLKARIDTERRDYFLEGFAGEGAGAESAELAEHDLGIVLGEK